MRNQLHFGDNLEVLRSGAIKPESVDLIYLDPPFNSNASYAMLFREPSGSHSQAQIEAFEDTWTWGPDAEEAFDDVLNGENQRLGKLLHALRDTLGDNSLMAYIAMMAVRLIELHKVLKPTGSIYLHCDTAAGHYLKILLDAVFGPERFQNDIAWKRTTAHNDPQRYGRIQDRILFYSKGAKKTFHPQGREYTPEQLARYKHNDEGGNYKAEQLTAPHFSATRSFEWRGTHPGAKRQWRFKLDELERLYAAGRILLRRDGCPRKDGLKEYIHEVEVPVVQDIWTDIAMGPTSGERLGYPTQKPVALLERIVAASSNEGDVVLDPFCGCGTTIHAAQRLKRKWIGIDITHLAVSLIESRLVSAFPGIQYDLFGTPKDLAGARQLAFRSKHQFELWALSLVKAQPGNDRKKGADHGIDGVLWLRISQRERAKVVVSVKGGFNVSVAMVRDLVGVMDREKAAIGLFITLAEPTGPMKAEAAKAGFYMADGERYPRLQIFTIEQLLEGRKPDLPLVDHAALRPIAAVDAPREDQHSLL